MDKRKLDLSIISDVHLGAYECHAKELLKYLRSINPEVLVLNGGFIAASRLQKMNFSKEHQAVIDEVLKMSNSGTKVYFINKDCKRVGNNYPVFSHKFIHFREKLELILNEQSYLIFHGSDIYSLTKRKRFALKLGKKAYNVILKFKKFSRQWDRKINRNLKSELLKNQFNRSEEVVRNFENLAIQIGKEKGYNYVICGCIHQPVIKQISDNDRPMFYMNSGDWVENLTALEYRFKKWKLYEYDELDYGFKNPRLTVKSKKSKITDDKRFSA